MAIKKQLSADDINLLKIFSQSARHSILLMIANARSGHPGGSLACVDYLALLYTQIIGQTGEKVVISNGHIAPAVYAVLAEMGYIDKNEAVENLRKINTDYEGHVTRRVPGVWYGTGPLGCGVSAASGFALAEKLKKSDEKVFAVMGDGESEEGQVYEMMNFAVKYRLDNFILFMDYNHVQLSGALESISSINPKTQWEASGWNVIEVNGHDYEDMWRGVYEAYNTKNRPTLLLGHTVMGKGVELMEQDGEKHLATWHGKAPKFEDIGEDLRRLEVNSEQSAVLENFKRSIKWKPKRPVFAAPLEKNSIEIGEPKVYEVEDNIDCRTAFGSALLDLAKLNKNIVGLTADLSISVKTDKLQKEIPERHIDCGIAEQHMVSCSGGMSLGGFIPFCSTFGAFMTSRAKDQARVNDLNQTNVKMVATHCGLSVGEDGPTHQAVDDMGSFLGLFNTMIIEPADPNHCDRIIRYIAGHDGQFYVRMGRMKVPVLTDENGEIFYGKDYEYEYGKCDLLRSGGNLTLVVCGAMASEALKARELLDEDSIEIIIVSSIKKFDDTLVDSIRKNKKVITVEDHCVRSGLGSQLARFVLINKIRLDIFVNLGVKRYADSGKPHELYEMSGISANRIAEKCREVLSAGA